MKRLLLLVLGLTFAGSLGLEAFARLVLGLGDPPLTVLDSDLEYRFAPNQDVRRFGNRVVYNQWSMRSEPIGASKSDPNELRVLVLGDSVINGGALTDQSRLATTLAERQLSIGGRPSRVLNVSAGSWGPENQLAYVRKFGLFDADVVILVVSTHDMADVMTFPADLGPAFPTERPLLATSELLTRYLPRYLPIFTGSSLPAVDTLLIASAPTTEAIARSRLALRELVAWARDAGARVYVVHHPEREEAVPSEEPLFMTLRDEVSVAGLPFLTTAELLGPVGSRGAFYRDPIHINERGQELYAGVILCLVSLHSEGDASSCTVKRKTS